MLHEEMKTKDDIMDAAEHLFMLKGYSGTSVQDILNVVGLTKGAFFHHFPSKQDLATAIIDRYAEQDRALLDSILERAEQDSDHPVEQVLTIFRLYRDLMATAEEPSKGCLFASFGYQAGLLDDDTNERVTRALHDWTDVVERKLEAAIAARPPIVSVSAHDLAEMSMVIFEGGLILSRTYQDARLMARQLDRFIQYLELLFRA